MPISAQFFPHLNRKWLSYWRERDRETDRDRERRVRKEKQIELKKKHARKKNYDRKFCYAQCVIFIEAEEKQVWKLFICTRNGSSYCLKI